MLLMIFPMPALAADDGVDPNTPLTLVLVLGASEVLKPLVEINLNARPNTLIGTIDVEAERNRVLNMGTFSEVSVNIEDRGEGPILVVRVQENPKIASVVIEGSTLDSALLEGRLAETNLLKPDAVYNSIRAQDGVRTIRQTYREQGWPFDVPVEVSVEALALDGLERAEQPVQVVYTITEEVPFSVLQFEGNTILSDEDLAEYFKSLTDQGGFTFPEYSNARRQANEAYVNQGFLGSGIDPLRSSLTNDILTLGIRELRISSINTTAIGISPNELSLQSGDLFNYDALLADVRDLAQGRTSDLQLNYAITPEGDVRVRFMVGAPDSAGTIQSVDIQGNTAFSNIDILGVLELGIGQVYTSALAQEDFRKIQELYTEAGYLIAPTPSFGYDSGVYTQMVQEVKIIGYEILFEGETSRTSERVVTRYLPDVGSAYNIDDLRSGILNVSRLGIVQPLDVQLSFPNQEIPSEAVVQVVVQDLPSRQFTPSLNYTTDNGLTTSVGYEDRNFLGQAHKLGLNVSGTTSDLGLLFGGGISYTVPWLDINIGDFQDVPTSFSVSLFSNPVNNQSIVHDASTRIDHPDATGVATDAAEGQNNVKIGEYTERSTGLSFSVGRPIAPFTRLNISLSGTYSGYTLEPVPTNQTCVLETVTNAANQSVQQVQDNDCFLPTSLSEPYLPLNGLSSFIGAGVVFDNRDAPEFPTEGVRATLNGGVGFGNDYRNAAGDQAGYVYGRIEAGASTYFALTPKNDVIALRINAGTQIGSDYPTARYFLVGDTIVNERLIRGFSNENFNRVPHYVTSSAEYRHNFSLGNSVLNTIVGIVFVDVGWTPDSPYLDESSFPVYLSGGIGLQFNVLSYPIRFDYGFSEAHNTGKLSFRIGFVF